MQPFEPGQQLKPEQCAEGERDFALAMGVHIVLLDVHLGVVSQKPLDHVGHLGGGATLELRVDAGRFLLDVPVDHDAGAAIADVPFGHQVLVPGSELLGVGGAGRRSLTPDVGMADAQQRVDNLGNGVSQMVIGDVAAVNIEQVFVTLPMFASAHALDSGVGAQSIQAQKQSTLQRLRGQGFPRAWDS